MSPLDFAGRLMAYCVATGASVTSWGRTPDHNRFVGGLVNSYHLVWAAGDVEYDLLPALELRKAHARHVGLELTQETDHDHLEPFP